MTQITLIPNKIKYINIEVIFDKLVIGTNSTTQMEIEDALSNMESSKEFQQLFFCSDEDDHLYYYQETDEQKIKDFMSQHIDISKLTEREFRDYGDDLYNWYGGEYIQIGVLQIEKDDIYEMLINDYLHNPQYVKKLVKSGKSFFVKMDQLKKQCLNHFVDVAISEIKLELKGYEFNE